MTYLNFVGPILSFSCCLVVGIVVSLVGVLGLRRWCGVEWRLRKVLRAWKGFVRWVFIGLVCFSTMFVQMGADYNGKGEFAIAIVVLIVCSAYPILELVLTFLE